MSDPVVAYVPDLMDRSRLTAAVADVVFVADPSELAGRPARLIVVDLARPGVLVALAAVAGGPAPVVGYCAHVDGELMAAARRAGCSEVLPRSRFFRRLGELAGPGPGG